MALMTVAKYIPDVISGMKTMPVLNDTRKGIILGANAENTHLIPADSTIANGIVRPLTICVTSSQALSTEGTDIKTLTDSKVVLRAGKNMVFVTEALLQFELGDFTKEQVIAKAPIYLTAGGLVTDVYPTTVDDEVWEVGYVFDVDSAYVNLRTAKYIETIV